MDENKLLLEQIFVSEVLILAKLISMERHTKGIQSSSDYTQEAVALIQKKHPGILQLLR